MALRVLLADESTTIKKVMQLALQDFAVEVKAVHSGIDVIEVAHAFQPDVIFADILLQKRNGYDVCGDIKKDSLLRQIPVVLMWSSFMDLDERAYLNSRANSRLEKPFDVETLRAIIIELVPKTQNQRLAHFLRFPASFVEPMEEEEKAKKSAPPPAAAKQRPSEVTQPMAQPLRNTPPPLDLGSAGSSPAITPPPLTPQSLTPPPITQSGITPPPNSGNWNMDSFEDINQFSAEIALPPDEDEDFEPVKIAKIAGTKSAIKPPPREEPPADSEEPWSHQDLARFKLDIPREDVESDEISLVFDMNDAPVEGTSFLLNSKSASASKKVDALGGEEIPPLNADLDIAPLELSLEIESTGSKPAPTMMPSDHGLRPVGQVRDFDGEVISQFSDHEHTQPEIAVPLDLEAPGPDLTEPPRNLASQSASHSPSHAGTDIPNLSADQLERIILGQSKEIIEAVVQKIVPDIATELIKRELERLLKEGGSQ